MAKKATDNFIAVLAIAISCMAIGLSLAASRERQEASFLCEAGGGFYFEGRCLALLEVEGPE